MSDAGQESDDTGPSSRRQTHVEALSTGRAKRATAGNRMRELLEQERERIQAEGDEPSGDSAKATKGKASKRDEDDEDAIFNDAAADGEEEDVDFEQRDDVEDVVDSDFDLSSDQGDEDDEEAGERELQEEEKAARKASRAAAQKVRVAPAPAIRRPPTVKRTVVRAADAPDGVAQRQRTSKRAATMQVADAVQARLQEDMKKREEMIKVATPKRKKVRLSQADLIAEALEMEDQNRESLKAFFEREEERRERDRRKTKKRIEGPFLRWRSVAVDRSSGQQRHAIEVLDERTGVTKPVQSLTLDPVFAAREAAVQERKRLAVTAADDGEARESSKVEPSQQTDVVNEKAESSNLHSRTSTSTSEIIAAPINADDVSMQEANTLSVENARPDEQSKDIDKVDGGEKADATDATEEQQSTDMVVVNNHAEPATTPVDEKRLPEWEARAYVSLHDLPASTPWPVLFGHVLGTHVDWSRYSVVPARNRPLRPRQSVCPITGLPAVYRDPRTGIAFANLEAYTNITKVLEGAYRWSGSDSDGDKADKVRKAPTTKSASQPSTDPLQLGCFLDAIDEPGANQVLTLAYQSTPSNPAVVSANNKPAPHGTTFQYVPRGALAPGDEQAVMAAAKALPAGSTRSGNRRSTTAM